MTTKRRNLPRNLVVLFVLGVGTVGGVILARGSLAQAASAQPTAAGHKWEYCAITWVPSAGTPGGGIKHYAKIVHFQLSGSQVEEIEGSSREDALSKGIAKLGENRWELVGENPYGRLFAPNSVEENGLYFKRSRP